MIGNLLACCLCCNAMNEMNNEIERKIQEIAAKGEKLPTDPLEYGYLRGQLDAYISMKVYLERSDYRFGY